MLFFRIFICLRMKKAHIYHSLACMYDFTEKHNFLSEICFPDVVVVDIVKCTRFSATIGYVVPTLDHTHCFRYQNVSQYISS